MEISKKNFYFDEPGRFIESYFTDGCRSCAPPWPYRQDAEFELAEIYYEKGLQVAKSEKEKATPLFQNALDIFTKLENEEWQQKVKIALESIK